VVSPLLVAAVGGRRCVVLGSAPFAGDLVIEPTDVVVAVSGGISSYASRCDVWVLNARTRADATIAGAKGPLHRLMREQGRDRVVGLLVLLSKADGAAAETVAALDAMGVQWQDRLEVNQTTRHAIETAAGARTPDLAKHALSAGLFAVAACLSAGAAHVRLAGFSWQGGYQYLPGTQISRGHEHGDKRALASLVARDGARLTHALPLPPTRGEFRMAKAAPRRRPTPKITAAAEPATATSASAPTARRAGPVMVRATKLLPYNLQRRRVGDVFALNHPSHFRPSCMERVESGTPAHTTSPAEASRKRQAEVAASKTPRLQPNAADPVDDGDEGPDAGAGAGTAAGGAALGPSKLDVL